MIDEETQAYHRKIAERVVAAHPDKHDKLNSGARMTIESLRQEMPGVSDEILMHFFSELAFMMAQFSALTVDSLVRAMDNAFNNSAIAAASLAGVYDLDDNSAPTQTLEEVMTAQDAEAADLNKDTGQYL